MNLLTYWFHDFYQALAEFELLLPFLQKFVHFPLFNVVLSFLGVWRFSIKFSIFTFMNFSFFFVPMLLWNCVLFWSGHMFELSLHVYYVDMVVTNLASNLSKVYISIFNIEVLTGLKSLQVVPSLISGYFKS